MRATTCPQARWVENLGRRSFADNYPPKTVLQAIKLRYAQKEIYTYSGIVLIATNPFAKVDSLYVPDMVQIYTGKQRSSQAPHLFAIAEEAFT